MESREIKLLEENNQLLKEQIQTTIGLQNIMLALSKTIPDLATALGQNEKMELLKAKKEKQHNTLVASINKTLEEEENKKGKIIPIKKK